MRPRPRGTCGLSWRTESCRSTSSRKSRDAPTWWLAGRGAANGLPSSSLEGLFRDTANATILTAGDKFNVVPSEALVDMDVRLLPGADSRGLLSGY